MDNPTILLIHSIICIVSALISWRILKDAYQKSKGECLLNTYRGVCYLETTVRKYYRNGISRILYKTIVFPDLQLPAFSFCSKGKHRFYELFQFSNLNYLDRGFTKTVFTQTDSLDVLQKLKTDEKLRKLLCYLLDLQNSPYLSYIEIKGGENGLAVSFGIKQKIATEAANEALRKRMDTLIELQNSFADISGLSQAVRRDQFARIILFADHVLVFLFCIAICQIFIPLSAQSHLLPPYLPFWSFVFGKSLLLWGSVNALLIALLRKSCYLMRVLVRTFLGGAIILTCFIASTIYCLNFELDTRLPQIKEMTVVGKYSMKNGNTKDGRTYYIQLQQKNEKKAEVADFSVSKAEFYDIEMWSTGKLQIKPGYFGFPWTFSMKLEPEGRQ